MAIIPLDEQLDQYCFFALIANSTTLTVGDSVIINTSNPNTVIGGADTTGKILGTVRGIVSGPAGGNLPLQTSSWAAASNNATVAQVQVKILPTFLTATYLADVDATLGTTSNSQYFGSFNLSTSLNGTLLESSYLDTGAEQFVSYGAYQGSKTQVWGIWGSAARM